MRYTTFGHRTGLRVSEYALGTANFGTGWGAGAEPDEARRIFDRFAEAGGTLPRHRGRLPVRRVRGV